MWNSLWLALWIRLLSSLYPLALDKPSRKAAEEALRRRGAHRY